VVRAVGEGRWWWSEDGDPVGGADLRDVGRVDVNGWGQCIRVGGVAHRGHEAVEARFGLPSGVDREMGLVNMTAETDLVFFAGGTPRAKF
jgi:hypothetical protein